MIFILNERPVFEILAICENEDELLGYRDEGPRVEIRLKEKISRLQFEYIPREVHPDVIALVCYCAFYPFIKEFVTFPLDISLNAKSLFERFYLQSKKDGKVCFLPPIKVRNASGKVRPYSAKKNTSLISFGGGMDSTALSLMFPGIHLVNQYKDFSQLLPMRGLYARIKEINPLTMCHSQYTNIRSLAVPEGYTGWTCCHLCTLLLLVDYGARTILSGSVLGSKYLGGMGARFIKPKSMVNRGEILESDRYFRDWGVLFLGLGIQTMDPVSGMSGILTAKVVYEKGLEEDVLYCQNEEGRPCHRCPKCFSKNLTLEYWEYIHTGKLRDKKYWERYDRSELVDYYSYLFRSTVHITNYLSQAVSLENKPEWFRKQGNKCNANTSWAMRVYSDPLENMPEMYRDIFKNGMTQHGLELMNNNDVRMLENYDIEDFDFTKDEWL